MIKQQRGFTLIELVLVIVILGILAATALPRFSDLSTEARTATVNGLAAAVRSAAAIAHATQLARGLAVGAQDVVIDGATVDFVNGYPAGAAGDTINNMLIGMAATDFTFAAGAPATWQRVGAGTPANCVVQYTASAGGGAFPTVATVTTGC